MASKEPPQAPKPTETSRVSETEAPRRPVEPPKVPTLKPIYSDWALI